METNKRSRETNNHVQGKVLPLIQTSVTSVAPVKGGLVKGRGCILSISLGRLRQRVRASPSHWAPKDRTMAPAASGVPRGQGCLFHIKFRGPRGQGIPHPCHTMNWSPGCSSPSQLGMFLVMLHEPNNPSYTHSACGNWVHPWVGIPKTPPAGASAAGLAVIRGDYNCCALLITCETEDKCNNEIL